MDAKWVQKNPRDMNSKFLSTTIASVGSKIVYRLKCGTRINSILVMEDQGDITSLQITPMYGGFLSINSIFEIFFYTRLLHFRATQEAALCSSTVDQPLAEAAVIIIQALRPVCSLDMLRSCRTRLESLTKMYSSNSREFSILRSSLGFHP